MDHFPPVHVSLKTWRHVDFNLRDEVVRNE